MFPCCILFLLPKILDSLVLIWWAAHFRLRKCVQSAQGFASFLFHVCPLTPLLSSHPHLCLTLPNLVEELFAFGKWFERRWHITTLLGALQRKDARVFYYLLSQYYADVLARHPELLNMSSAASACARRVVRESVVNGFNCCICCRYLFLQLACLASNRSSMIE